MITIYDINIMKLTVKCIFYFVSVCTVQCLLAVLFNGINLCVKYQSCDAF